MRRRKKRTQRGIYFESIQIHSTGKYCASGKSDESIVKGDVENHFDITITVLIAIPGSLFKI